MSTGNDIEQYLFAEECLEFSQTSKMELFAKIVNGFQLSTIFTKKSILDVWLSSECASILCHIIGDDIALGVALSHMRLPQTP